MKRNMKIGGSIIKIGSLGVGMAIGLVILSQVCFQLSYDRYISDVDRLYMIRTESTQQGSVREFHNISGAVAPGFKSDVPGVEEATRFTWLLANDRFIDEEKNLINAEHPLLMADSSFFALFPREFLAGTPQQALKSWSGAVAVSRSFAEKLGGVGEAVGKMIRPEEIPGLNLHVVGVYEDYPENSTVQADVLVSIEGISRQSTENWVGNDRYTGFVRLADGVSPESLAPSIRKMQEIHQPIKEAEKNGVSLRYYLKPLKNYHISDQEVRSQVIILSVIAFLLLMVSLMNYILTAVTEVVKRSREVGVRKCCGAGVSDIYLMLFKESGTNILLSIAVAVAVISVFRNTIEALIRNDISDMLVPATWWTMGVTVVLIFLVSSIVPARLFEKIPVSSAFRGYKETRRRWKQSLLSLQFIINVFLLIMVLVSSLQYSKVLNEDVGYDPDNLVYLTLNGTGREDVEVILDRLNRMPEVKGAAVTFALPLNSASGNNVRMPGETRDLFNIADQYEASPGYHSLMGFRLLDGEYPQAPNEILVNQSFLDRIGQFEDWSDGAVGKVVRVSEHSDYVENEADGDFIVCGVVENVRIGNSTENDTRPVVWFCSAVGKGYMKKTLVVRLAKLNQKNIDSVSGVIKEFGNELDCSVRVYSEALKDMYVFQKNMKNTFLIGAAAALLIAFFGLLGFLRDESNRRAAEVAVRKVNGAQSHEVVAMFVCDILKLGLAAVVAGDVAGWLAASEWLEQFPVRIDLQFWQILAADALFLMVIVLTSAVCSLRVAYLNPALSLKKD